MKSFLKEDIIEPAVGPTPWVSPVVLVPKPKQPGSVRLCVDMREANKAICWLRHPMPILDWIWTKVNSSYPCILTHDISAHFLSPLVCLDTNASVFESMLLQKCFKMWLPQLLVKFPMGKNQWWCHNLWCKQKRTQDPPCSADSR